MLDKDEKIDAALECVVELFLSRGETNAPVSKMLEAAAASRVEIDIIDPLATGAQTLHDHLRNVLRRDDAFLDASQVSRRVGALDLEKPVMADQAVWRCPEKRDFRMMNEAHELNVVEGRRLIRDAGVIFVIDPPLHGRVEVGALDFTGDALCDQSVEQVVVRDGRLAVFSHGEERSGSGCREATAPIRVPFGCALQVVHLLLLGCVNRRGPGFDRVMPTALNEFGPDVVCL